MRVLIISPYYPPCGNAQSLQIGKVVTAMGECGIETIVIAGKPNNPIYETLDTDRVFRVPHWIRPIRKSIAGRIFTKVLQEIYSCNIFSRFVTIAVDKTLEIIKNEKIDCLLTSSTPFESHMVGIAVSQKTGIPWIASFSDPWPASVNPYPYNVSKIPILSFFQEYMLRNVLKKCHSVHLTNKYAVDLMENFSGITLKGKTYVIPHIGNPKIENHTSNEYKGWLAHIGSLTRERVSLPLLLAISRVHKDIPEFFNGLLCVGDVCTEFKELIKKLNLEKCIRLVGHMSQKEAHEIAQGADALLVIEANMKASPYLPSKFADYILTDKPIIVVTPLISPIRDFLNAYSHGTPVSHDEDEITDVIKRTWMARADQNFCWEDTEKNRQIRNIFTSSFVGNEYKKIFSEVCSLSK